MNDINGIAVPLVRNALRCAPSTMRETAKLPLADSREWQGAAAPGWEQQSVRGVCEGCHDLKEQTQR